MEIVISQKEIENRIFTIRGLQIMLDSHLADMYGITTSNLNKAAKRNEDRFPYSFRFQLSDAEWEHLRFHIGTLNKDALIVQIETSNDDPLRFQNGTLKTDDGLHAPSEPLKEDGRGRHRKYLPYVYTEQGVAMLSAVLRSNIAVKVSVHIMNAFVEMRKMVLGNAALFQRLDKVELKQMDTDQKFEQLFKALESREQQPEKGIFFDGQVFDAYVFVSDLVKRAKSNIILIDNYIDETVLAVLAKRAQGVTATIYTKQTGVQLQSDLKKHNHQYPAIEIKTITKTHDRFLLLDHKELYHLGASLKDLGKKWFAFSRMDDFANEILNRLQHND